MASAMRKMAVYLGLVEDDHRYQDKYDSYGEYEDYDDQADRPEQIANPLCELNRWLSLLPAAGDYGTQKLFVFRKMG